MLIYHKDPKGLLGSEQYKINTNLSIQENIEYYFPDGINTDNHDIILNGEIINPLNYDLSRKSTIFDIIQVIKRQQATGVISLVIAVIAAVVSYALTPKPKMPNNVDQQKDSQNNKLQGQTNRARAYQAKPDIYGCVRAYPDLVKPSGSEYIDNIKYIDHLMCIGVGQYDLNNFKYSETLLDQITGTTYEVYHPGDIIPSIMYQYASDEVNGQELIPPNLNTEPLRELIFKNYISFQQSNNQTTFILNASDDVSYLKGLYLPTQVDYTVSASIEYTDSSNTTQQLESAVIYRGNLQSVQYDKNKCPELKIFNSTLIGYKDTIQGSIKKITYNHKQVIFQRKNGVYTDVFPLPEKGREIWVDLAFHRGLKGGVTFKFVYWQIDDYGHEIINTRETYDWNISKDTYEPQNVTVKIIPKKGEAKYAIICGRMNDGKSDLSDQVKIENIYIVNYNYNVLVKDTLVYIRTKATSQATGVKTLKFNVEATRKTISYNIDNHQIIDNPRASRSFADAVLHEFCIVAGRDSNELDLDALYTIDQAIKMKDQRLGYFDFSFDDEDISLGQRIETICNTARVFAYRDGQKWRFCRDEIKTRPVAMFNSLNLVNTNDGGTVQYKSNLPSSYDGIELEYIDSSHDNPELGTDKKAYIRLKIDTINQIITEEKSRQPNKIQLSGCRNKYQAMNRAQLEARKLIYQRISIEDEAMQDANFVNKGDLVRWCDTWDDIVVNGEVITIEDNRFFVNQELELDSNKHYRVSITDKSGYPSDWITIIEHDDESFVANFDQGYVANNIDIQMGSLFIITETIVEEPTEYILTEKRYSEGNYRIHLVNYDPRVFEFD